MSADSPAAKKRRFDEKLKDGDAKDAQTRDKVGDGAKGDVAGDVASQLDSAKEFILNIFSSKKETPESWSLLSTEWQKDSEIALAALKNNIIRSITDLPESLQYDREFMLKAVSEIPKVWLELPDCFEGDREFVHAISRFDHVLATAVVQRHPDLCGDGNFWFEIMEDSRRVALQELFQEYAPENIRSNSEIMLKAASVQVQTLSQADESLFRQRDFVEKVLAQDEEMLSFEYIPHECQIMWVDLIERAFHRNRRWPMFDHAIEGEARNTVRHVAPSLWDNRRVVLAWFSGGGPFVDGVFPEKMKDDEEIFLLIAQNCVLAVESFYQHASSRLTSDKDFMLKAVLANSYLFFNASAELKEDFDLIVASFVTNTVEDELGTFLSEIEHSIRNRAKFRLHEQLVAHANFTRLVLPGMLLGGDSCPLTLLNQEIGHKKLIAEFLDVPLGDNKLNLTRAALGNILAYEVVRRLEAEESEQEEEEYRRMEAEGIVGLV